MKRYDVFIGEVEESNSGRFVKYSDHTAEMEKINNMLENRIREIVTLKRVIGMIKEAIRVAL